MGAGSDLDFKRVVFHVYFARGKFFVFVDPAFIVFASCAGSFPQPLQFFLQTFLQGGSGFFSFSQDFGFLFQPGTVVAFERSAFALFQFKYPFSYVVEKIPIMGGNDDIAEITRESVFQPLHGFGIKMVGGFVQKKHIGFLQEQFAKGYSPGFASRQGARFLVIGRKHEGIHRHFHLPVQLPSIGSINLILKPAHFFHGFFHFLIRHGFGHFRTDFVELFNHFFNVRKGLFYIFPDGFLVVQSGLLGQEPNCGSL